MGLECPIIKIHIPPSVDIILLHQILVSQWHCWGWTNLTAPTSIPGVVESEQKHLSALAVVYLHRRRLNPRIASPGPLGLSGLTETRSQLNTTITVAILSSIY